MSFKKILWLIPFFFFIMGYFAAQFLFHAKTLPTPSVVGLPLARAVKELSQQGIGVRISAHKPSTETPEGTVLIQVPSAGQAIKTHQTVSLVVAEEPPLPKTPSFLGLSKSAIEKEAAQKRLAITFAALPHHAPTETCYAQFPAPGQPLSKPSMIVYYSVKSTPLAIWPSFIGKSLEESMPWFEEMNIRFEITSASSWYSDKKKLLQAPIIDQYPRAGTIVYNETDKLPTALLHLP